MDRKTKRLRRSNRSAPTNLALTRRYAWTLSIVGLLPFVGLSLALLMLPKQDPNYPIVVAALKTGGAVLLSFLGGVRWGLALSSASEAWSRTGLALSLLPALLGWTSLYLGAPHVFAVQAIVLAGQGAWDVFSGEKGAYGLWFARLRTVLTFLVTGAFIVAFFATV